MSVAVIVSGCRTAVGKAPKGSLRNVRPDELAALCIRKAVARAGGVEPREIDDVVLGCAYPEAQQGRNIARMAALRAGLPDSAAGATVNRLCASGLEAIAIASQRISAGWAEIVVAGGVESMSQIPRGGHAPSPNPHLVEQRPDAYLTMGLTGERIAEAYKISREDQDDFSLSSHRKATLAIDEGRFQREIVPVEVDEDFESSGRWERRTKLFDVDEGVRPDSSPEGLAKLPPAFKKGGTVTAGNSSQTSDGAAALLLVSETQARSRRLVPLGRLVSYSVAGCAPETMGLGPIYAVPKALESARLKLGDVDLIELNEAFAVQALAVARTLSLPMDKLNVSGGAIALGHPLGCTGAKLVVTILHELARRRRRFGLVTLCVGGGMGVAAVVESLAW